MAVSAIASPPSTATAFNARDRYPVENPSTAIVGNMRSRGHRYSTRPTRRRAYSTTVWSSYAATSSFFMQQDPYTTLGLSSDASEEEIKKARRKLALKFHPDVCKADSSTAKFIQIEQAYETIMDCLHGKKSSIGTVGSADAYEGMMGVYDDSWEDWEEWMGWEGAGTRDYTSHINHSL